MLILLAQAGYIRLWYGDESGFSLTPSVPYGWTQQGQQVGILSQRSARLNVFGLLGTDNQLISYPRCASVNTAFVTACLDDFVSTIAHPTVVVLDNAPMHRSEAFRSKLPEWQEKGLYIFFLPSYSPHLNRIERIWKQIKYSWLRAEDYFSFENLKQAVIRILAEFGTTFTLNFEHQTVAEKLVLNSD